MIGAVDIGGTKTAVAAISETGEIGSSVEWRTADHSPKDLVRKTGEWFQSAGRNRIAGVGISCTGPVDPATGVIGRADLLPGWEGFPLCEALSGELGLSVGMENDADAAALAEAAWGAGRHASRFVYITISTGIGGGMIIDGDLYRGVAGSHPELGHQSLDAYGPPCYCGSFGCWEVLASGPAMAKWAVENWPRGELEAPENIDAEEICRLARDGHPFASEVVHREANWIGIGVANVITTFCPDVIALGGGVIASADLLLQTAREVVRTRCGLVPHEKVNITTAVLGKNAALIGAARVWQMRFDRRSVICAS